MIHQEWEAPRLHWIFTDRFVVWVLILGPSPEEHVVVQRCSSQTPVCRVQQLCSSSSGTLCVPARNTENADERIVACHDALCAALRMDNNCPVASLKSNYIYNCHGFRGALKQYHCCLLGNPQRWSGWCNTLHKVLMSMQLQQCTRHFDREK